MLSSRGKLLKWSIVVAVCLAVLPLNVYAAATGKVKGTLIDAETKEPVIGASVFIVGTRLGAQSDLDGNYSVDHSAAVLVIKYRTSSTRRLKSSR